MALRMSVYGLQISLKPQGPNYTVPFTDPLALVGQPVWRATADDKQWIPGMVADYVAAADSVAAMHCVVYHAGTESEFEERIDLMRPREQISWQDAAILRAHRSDDDMCPQHTMMSVPAESGEVSVANRGPVHTPTAMMPRAAMVRF
jgi:hypothetical protein